MLKLYCRAKALWATHDRGASAVEYALLVIAIVAAVGALVYTLGGTVSGFFEDANDKIQKTTGPGGGGGGGS